jgi:SAM-dependent methyltransferase
MTKDPTTPAKEAISPAALARLRRSIRRHVSRGWLRAVFARPHRADEEPGDAIEVPGPTAGTPSAGELDELIARAEAAAREGLVKQTYVIDERTRVRIDARYGKAKLRELDDATVTKMMGGKDRPLRPDRSADLLRVIGIMNSDGSISSQHAKKYKQVNHFVEICRPIWEAIEGDRPLRILDLACGNGYLTFVIAEALRLRGTPARIHGIDLREDVIARCIERTNVLGWPHVTFSRSRIEDAENLEAELDGPPDLVVALHACDTATDDALALALRLGARAILAAPCCQHELARQLPEHAEGLPAPMLAQGLLRRDHAALLTDALRVQVLEACGYTVDLLEFVHGSHTPKNLLIRARLRNPAGPADWDLDSAEQQCARLGVSFALLRRLEGARAR